MLVSVSIAADGRRIAACLAEIASIRDIGRIRQPKMEHCVVFWW